MNGDPTNQVKEIRLGVKRGEAIGAREREKRKRTEITVVRRGASGEEDGGKVRVRRRSLVRVCNVGGGSESGNVVDSGDRRRDSGGRRRRSLVRVDDVGSGSRKDRGRPVRESA